MTLLDASIIIDGLRCKDLHLVEEMRSISGVICGVTRAEVLSGARSAQDHAKLLIILNGFGQVAIPESMWDAIGQTQARLRSHGLTVPLADAILVTVALSLGAEVWTRDAHFSAIQKLIPTLRLRPQTS
jgi:predicted nucleic acid-binding protein